MAVALPGLGTAARHAFRRPAAPALIWVPALLVVGAILLPVAYLLVRTTGADEGVWPLLFSARTRQLFANTVTLGGAVAATAIALAVPLAWLTARTDLPGAALWRILTVLPLVVPSYVGAFVLITVLGPTGMVQRVLERVGGVNRLPEIYGFPGAWLTLSLFTFPYVLLSVRAGLRGIDPSIEEASRALGHTGWHTFRRVTLPLLRPWIGAGALLVILYVFSDFGAVSMMQFDSFTTAIYLQYQASFNRSYAAALSLVLVALSTIMVLLEGRQGRGRYHRIGSATARLPRRVRLGAWRWPAVGFCAGVVGAAVVLPVCVITYWLLVGLKHGGPPAASLRPALNSLYAAGLSGALTVAAAMPVALLTVRYRGTLPTAVARLSYAGYALPGIVVALSLVFFGARFALPLYQTLALLVFAYMVLFLPQALGPLRSALQQVSPAHEESARTLGRTPREVVWTVTVPLVRSGAIAAGALVFLTTMKELPATLLLSPIGFETLATRIWSAATEGLFARAAVPALLLVLASACSIGLLLSGERTGWRDE